MKRFVIPLLLLCILPHYVWAGRNSDNLIAPDNDSTILFRFVPGKLMFFSPFKGNENSIKRAFALIDDHREEITSGKAYILIRGFCGSYPDQAQNLKAAKNRSNQVKSYFITNWGMKEEYYKTKNSTKSYNGSKDVVALLGLLYADGYDPEAEARALREREDSIARVKSDSLAKLRADSLARVKADSLARVETEAARLARMRADNLARADSAKSVAVVASEVEERIYVEKWALKTNMLYDLLLSPSLEIEYLINDKWSVNIEGNVSWWHKNETHRYYQIMNISPEVRYWFGKKKDWHGHYLGAFVGGGMYDLENKGTGYKGEGGYAGISYGYMFPIGKSLSLETGLGLGYMYSEYEEYIPLDGHYVYQQTGKLNYFGPLKLKLALVWRIGGYKKGGAR